MKISCQSCSAKYTIADEKVLGKIVKIRCKKCGATIVINGNEGAGAAVPAAEDSNQDTRVFDYTSQQGGSGDQWTVNVNDGDQRTMTLAEIVNEYKAGVINEESFCWKDGMSDWLPLREIGELYAACTIGPRLSLTPEQASQQDDALPGGGLGALFGGGGSAGRGGPSPMLGGDTGLNVNGNGMGALFGSGTPSAAAAASSTSQGGAARRAGGRGAVGDLFGAVEQAGGEHDVLAAPKMPEPSGEAGKLTGQRNENSVLFSLSALTKNEPKDTAPMAQGEGSGLIDIRALSASSAPRGGAEGAKVDDIMNLAGGGAFSPALAAPVLAPPPLSSSDVGYAGGDPRGPNKMILVAILGLCALIAAAIVVMVVLLRKPDAAETANAGTTTMPAITAPGTPGAPTTPGAVAANDPPPTMATPAPTTGGAAPPSTGTPVATHDKGDPPKAGAKATGGGTKPAGFKTTGGSDTPVYNPPPTAPAPAPPKGLEEAMKQSAGGGGAAAPAAAAATAPFDRGAAMAALGAAAASVGSCKRPDGPTGTGHVKVTFQPNGTVSTVEVDQPPFAGTSVGGCVAGKFKSARIPAFSGGSMAAGKTFSIN